MPLASARNPARRVIANLVAIEANTRLNAEKVAQFYDKFSQVVIPNPNGDTAFGIKTIG